LDVSPQETAPTALALSVPESLQAAHIHVHKVFQHTPFRIAYATSLLHFAYLPKHLRIACPFQDHLAAVQVEVEPPLVVAAPPAELRDL
jgi:hypothetical protein